MAVATNLDKSIQHRLEDVIVLNRHAHIADVAALTGGESPTEAEFNALAVKFNAVLDILEALGAAATS